QHVVATFNASAAKLFVNGRTVANSNQSLLQPITPNGNLLVGCAGPTTSPQQCFDGAIGELRIYPDFWSEAPRVTDSETEINLPANSCQFDTPNPAQRCPHDFGQVRRTYARNDMAVADDDAVDEFEYED